MPELPEVETIRRDLEPVVTGKVITDVKITEPRMVRRNASPAEVEEAVRGGRVVRLGRRGKFLLFELGDGGRPPSPPTLVVHFGMSGQALYLDPSTAERATDRDRHIHVRIFFDDGSLLYVRDPRMFGEIFVTPDFEASVALGPEPLSDSFGPGALAAALASRSPVKSALLDQRRVAGLGNIYADEALYRAEVHPLRPAASLSPQEAEALTQAIREVLREAIEHRGSTIAAYRDAFGDAGGMQARHLAYGREGEFCARCGGRITRVKLSGRSTFFCSGCQR